jgi:carboxymethylenebutenolidase
MQMFAAAGDSDGNLPGVLAAARWAHARGGKVASIGFCMGGGLSARLAAHDPALAGAIVFYGMSPPDAEAAKIRCPVLGLYGALDPRINASVPAFQAAAGERLEVHTYDGAYHAFFNETRPVYSVDAARDAWARALGFLARVTAA